MDDMPTLTLEHRPGPVPLGANLLADGAGATFRVWAPAARQVRLRWDYARQPGGNWVHRHEAHLQRLEDGTWGLVRASSNKPELVVVIESPTSEENMRAMFREMDAILSQHPEVGDYNQKL